MLLTKLPDTSGINRQLLTRAFRLPPDCRDQDINTALLKAQAVRNKEPVDEAEPGGPNLDGDLLRQVIGQPDASDDEVNSTLEALAALTNPDNFKALSAAAPNLDARFKSASLRTAQDEAENIRQRLGISREAWNKGA